MNRKLVNGLLLLTLVTGGSSLFTSCKDTDEDYKNEVIKGQANLETQFKELKEKVDKLKQCNCPSDLLDQLDNIVTKLDDKLDKSEFKNQLEGQLGGSGKLADLNKLIEDYTELSKLLGENGTVADLEERVAALKKAVTEIEKILDYLTSRLNSLITSIELNQIWNPVFGSLNFPMGITSTILTNYLGEAQVDVTFPVSGSTASEYNGSASVLTSINTDVLAALANAAEGKVSLTKGDKVFSDATDGNVGHLYLTINPNNIEFTDVDLTLVNSKDEALKAEVSVKPLDDEEGVLTFGLSRAAQNGLYRVNVNVAEDDAEALLVDMSGLKTAVKDLLKDRSKQDLVNLAKVVYDQMQGKVPAYAVKAAWEVDGYEAPAEGDTENATRATENYATYSSYSIAAATFKPLSYRFMEDVHFSNPLPTFEGTIQDAIHNLFDEFTFTFDLGLTGVDKFKDITISLADVNVEFGKMEIKIDLRGKTFKTDDGDLVFDDSDDNVITLVYNPATATAEASGDLADFVDSISEAITDMLKGDNGIQATINKAINEQVIKQVNDLVDSINTQLTGINGKINNQLKDKIKDIENSLAGKLGKADKLLNKYNKLAQKLNAILANPNQYVQILGAYEDAQGNFQQLSSDVNYPSVFETAGGDALTVYLTSYTGEVLVPSYKKYVAVTNVYNADGSSKNLAASAIVDLNGTLGLNKVLPGHQQEVALAAAGLEAGNIYELVYTSVDYEGWTSSRKYYVVVK